MGVGREGEKPSSLPLHFSPIKIVFFAQSMQAISLTSLPSLAFYSFTMFTNQKINILIFLAPVSLFFCFSIKKQKLEHTCSHFPFYTYIQLYNVKLLQLPKALDIALYMCPKISHYDITV